MMLSYDMGKPSPGPFVLLSGRTVVIACILCPIIMCAITFPLFLGLHKGRMDTLRNYPQIPTISGTGQFLPERLIFTYGLHLEGVLLAVLFMLVHVKFRNKIRDMTDRAWSTPSVHENQNQDDGSGKLAFRKALNYLFCFWRTSEREKAQDYHYLTFWNNTLTILGLTAAFLLTAVGTVSLSVQSDVHTGLAVAMFVCAVLHMLCLYFTLARVLDVTECDVILHRVCLFMTIPFNLLLVLLTAIMWATCPEGLCVQAAVDLVVVIEYSTAVFILLYIFRFFNIVQTIGLACSDSGPVVTDRVVERDFESAETKKEAEREERKHKVRQEQETTHLGRYNPYCPPAHSLAQLPDPQIDRAPVKPSRSSKPGKPGKHGRSSSGSRRGNGLSERASAGASAGVRADAGVYGTVNYGGGSDREGKSAEEGDKMDADVKAGAEDINYIFTRVQNQNLTR